MTEEEWSAAVHPGPMLELVRGFVSDRKLRLFACACIRRLWSRLIEPSRIAVCLGEDYADNIALWESLNAAATEAYWETLGDRLEFHGTRDAINLSVCELPSQNTYEAACRVVARTTGHEFDQREGHRAQAELLRHIAGNPFPLEPVASLCSHTVRDLAEAVYQQNASAVPPLHDALLDAGLTELAKHFLDSGTWHPKGCWAVDLLTGRT